ncbi:DUF4436 family protein [Rhodococcus sp. Eu-32]|uniref:DUF4436 family protein n=1 Tax=Rhodococcus sp. Eu-32 TaxID=1017319 RepID=UPI001FB1F460|nr:DUF4436 family protein [Rhodococcus sp. Eu-32]
MSESRVTAPHQVRPGKGAMGMQDTDGAVSQRKPWRAASIALLVVALYVVVVTIYGLGDRARALDTREPSASGALVYLDFVGVDGANFSIDARVTVYPGQDLVDDDGYLKDDLVVDVSPLAAGDRLEYVAGTTPGAGPVTLYADGDITRWPFDVHDAADVAVRVTSESVRGSIPIATDVAVTDSLSGWNVRADDPDRLSPQSFGVTANRTAGSVIFALALCVVLLVLPVCALFVTVQTVRERKKFQPPMVTWFAVMLFAVLPLRNLFPGSPPIGSWVDYTVVLWVVAGLVTAMGMYVLAWWRQAP